MRTFETLSEGKRDLVKAHLRYVIEANKTMNLTRIDDVEEAMLLHVEDSLEGLPELESAPAGLYGDLGSGAGYPGIPLAIATGRQTVLIDTRQKKMNALDSIIGKLGLSDKVSTYAGRAELLARKRPGAFSALTARALSQLSVLLELSSPLLEKDGVLVCYKAKIADDELKEARRVQALVGMKLESDRSFMLGGIYERRILTFRKHAVPKVKLPRQEGQAQKQPL